MIMRLLARKKPNKEKKIGTKRLDPLDKNLRKAFEDRVIVAPVGPICVRALTEEGVSPHVVPKHPKMGPLVLAVAEYFDKLDVSITNPLRKIDSNNSEKQT